MADKFATAHAGTKKAEARVNDIFVVRQTTGEGLQDFLARFNRVRMSLPNVSEGMVVPTFQNGLNRSRSKATKKLLSRLMKYPPTTWEEIHNAYCAEVRADEDDLNGPLQRLTPVQTKTRRDRQIVYALEKLGTKVQWPQKMKSDPSTRRSNVLCEFYQERGHNTEDCIGLRQEVVRMLNQGYLKELLSDMGRANFARGRDPSQGPPKPPSPARTIQMIIGGCDDT
uniref:Retrotransposon gag domain-containing protein n=1 Tax=Nicotiana tabacum TaxID=4097 RepID=A0A1S4BMC5_TOBAC